MDAVTAEKMTGEEQHRDLRDLQLIWSSYFSPSMTPETPEEVDTTSIILDGVLDEADDPSLLSEALTNPLVPETLIPSLVTSCPGIELKAPRTIRAGRQVSAGRRVYMVAKLTSYWDMAGGLRDGGLILTLPEGLKYVGAVLSPMAPGYAIHPDLSGQTVAWTALDLAAGKSFKFRLELKVLPGGPATRTLTVQATVDGSTCGRSAAVEVSVRNRRVVSIRNGSEKGRILMSYFPSPSYTHPSTHLSHISTHSSLSSPPKYRWRRPPKKPLLRPPMHPRPRRPRKHPPPSSPTPLLSRRWPQAPPMRASPRRKW